MRKPELITKISEHTNETKKKVEVFLDAFELSIMEELKNGGEVVLPGFAKFFCKDYDERQGYNPSTLQPTKIAAHKSVKVKILKHLKECLKSA